MLKLFYRCWLDNLCGNLHVFHVGMSLFVLYVVLKNNLKIIQIFKSVKKKNQISTKI